MSYLFVGNLSKNITEKILFDLFSQCGLCAVELKGPYAFVRYNNKEESQKAINRYHNTNLEGLNGFNNARIEFSKKSAIDDFLLGKFYSQNNLEDQKPLSLEEKNESENFQKNSMHHRKEEKSKNNNNLHRNSSQNISRATNVCFICKLPGHFAKECVLTRDTCYECGIKGHMAKECQAGVRQAKSLNYNRVKAIFSQQSSFKFLSHKQKFNIYINSIKNDLVKY